MMTRYTNFDATNQSRWAKLTRTALQEQYDEFKESMPQMYSGFEGGEREEQPAEATKGSAGELTRMASKKTSVGNVSRFMKEQPSVSA